MFSPLPARKNESTRQPRCSATATWSTSRSLPNCRYVGTIVWLPVFAQKRSEWNLYLRFRSTEHESRSVIVPFLFRARRWIECLPLRRSPKCGPMKSEDRHVRPQSASTVELGRGRERKREERHRYVDVKMSIPIELSRGSFDEDECHVGPGPIPDGIDPWKEDLDQKGRDLDGSIHGEHGRGRNLLSFRAPWNGRANPNGVPLPMQ